MPMMPTPRIILLALLTVGPLLQGCAPLLFGGAVTGAAVAHDRRNVTTFVQDQAVEMELAQSLHDDPILKDSHVSVTSINRRVLLSGEVPTREAGVRAAELARAHPKVERVHNELVIAPAASLAQRATDSATTARVKSSLFKVDLPGFDPTRVKVVTERGTVYLMGLLRAAEAEAATERARRVGGVRKVVRVFELVD